MKRRGYFWVVFLLTLLVFFTASELFSSEGEAKNIILISLDGTERKVLKELLEDEKLPNLSQIMQEGQYRDIVLEGHKSVTRPSHATMLTGYLPSVHGVYSNFRFSPIPEGLTIFERLEKHFAENNIITIMTWAKGRSMRGWSKKRKPPFLLRKRFNGFAERNLPQRKGIRTEYEYTKKHLDVYGAGERHADEIGTKDLEYLEQYKDKRFFAFFHFTDPDHAGHEYGYSDQYRDAIVECDRWVGKIYKWVKDNGLLDNTIIYVTTDHGWDDDFKDHNNAPRSWLITNDKEIKKGGNIADIAVTILDRFGVDWRSLTPPLYGRPLTETEELVKNSDFTGKAYKSPVFSVFKGSKVKNSTPVYSLISFNINLQSPENVGINIKTIRRHLNLMKKYHLKADYYFTWSALKQIIEEDPSLIDEIKDAGMDIHHHGANRPPGKWLVERLKGKSWKEDVEIATDYMTHDIDPETGKLLASNGGLLKMEEILGLDFFSTGRFFEAPILYVAKKLGAKMCVGLKGNTGSPIADAWFMGVLNSPEDFGLSYKVYINGDEENAIKRMGRVIAIHKEDESFFLAIPVHDHDFYLFRPGGGSFGQGRGVGERRLFSRGSGRPSFGEFRERERSFRGFRRFERGIEKKEELLSEERQEEIWQSYERVISWLASNDTIKNTTMREVYNMAKNDLEPVITKAMVEKMANQLSSINSLPDYLTVDDMFFSLADSFQALAVFLSRYYQEKTFPERVKITSLIGPAENYEGIDRTVSVSIEDILKASEEIANSDKEDVPSSVSVGLYRVNSAEFLIAMAQALEKLSGEDRTPEVTIKDMEMLPLSARKNSKVSTLTKLQFWTLKPVRWKAVKSYSSPVSKRAVKEKTFKNKKEKETTGKQQPIYVVFNIHFDPVSFAPAGLGGKRPPFRRDRKRPPFFSRMDDAGLSQSDDMPSFLGSRERRDPEELYRERRDNIKWLYNFLDELEEEGGIDRVLRVNLQLGGDQAEYYMEDAEGLSILKEFYNKGIHTFGVHFHNNRRQGKYNWPLVQMGSWVDIQSDRKKVTEDHIEAVDKLMGMVIGSSDMKKIREVNHNILGHMLDKELAIEKGFYIITGGENEKFNNFFDHDVYNPWRPSQRWVLTEDKSTPYVLIPQAPAIGRIGGHIPKKGPFQKRRPEMESGIWQDNSVAAMKRKFLHLYLEWLWWKRTEPEGKVWTFGWTLHANNLSGDDGRYGDHRYLRDELVEFVQWLNKNFIGKKTPQGSTIAVYSNMDEIYEKYLEWEKNNPGKSSFSYPYKETNWDAYPYKLKGLARELMYSHYAGRIDNYTSRGIKIYKFIRTDGKNWTFKNGKDYCNGPTEDIYVLFSEKGKQVIDLSFLFKGEISVVDGLDGSVKKTNAGNIEVGETPVIVFK